MARGIRGGAVRRIRHYERYSHLTPTQVAGLRRRTALREIEKVWALDDGFIPYPLGPLTERPEWVCEGWNAYKRFRFASGRIWAAVRFAQQHPERFTVTQTPDGWVILNHAYRYLIAEVRGTPYRCAVMREEVAA